MRILITGGTGLIGRRLVVDRLKRRDEIVVVSRNAARAADVLGANITIVEGDPVAAGPWQTHVDGCDAVVHLAGAGVADRRWTRAYKQEIKESRIESTCRVVEAIQACTNAPSVLVNASAVGYYGERRNEPVDETEPPGDDFLARLSVEWERHAGRAAESNVRVVTLRTGVVLDPQGGALAKMLPIFKLGLGGPLGSGRQYLPWIAWPDVVGLIDLALTDSTLSGPLNVVAPEAVTNRVFARTLARALHRPALLPVPVIALRAVMGQMGAYAVISQRVVPDKALQHGYAFRHPRLEPALNAVIAAA